MDAADVEGDLVDILFTEAQIHDKLADMAARIAALEDPRRWAAEQQRSLRFVAQHSAERQRDRLEAAYGYVPAELVLS